jgi:hypothetical protein
MNLIKTLAAVMIPLLFAGCGTMMREIKEKDIAIEFDQSARGYNRMVRWHELDSAEAYVTPKLRDEFHKRIIAAGEVTIVDYRVKSMECSPVKKEGSVRVEFDYYRPPSVTLRTREDHQLWTYEGEEGKRAWRLTTLLPDFK